MLISVPISYFFPGEKRGHDHVPLCPPWIRLCLRITCIQIIEQTCTKHQINQLKNFDKILYVAMYAEPNKVHEFFEKIYFVNNFLADNLRTNFSTDFVSKLSAKRLFAKIILSCSWTSFDLLTASYIISGEY